MRRTMMRPLKNLTLLLVLISAALLSAVLTSAGCRAPNADQAPGATPAASLTPPAAASPTPVPSPTPSATPEPQSSLGVAAQDLAGTLVRLWHPWRGELAAVLNELVEEFNQENEWGIRVQATPQMDLDVLWQAAELSSAAGQGPELGVGYLHQILALPARAAMVDFQVYVSDPVWGLAQEAQQDFYPAFWQVELTSGRRMGFPALRYGQVLLYNQSWAGELGFTQAAQTFDQLSQQACAAAQAYWQDADEENNGRGGMILTTQYPWMQGWLKAYGVSLAAPEGAGYQVEGAPTQAAFEALLGMYDEGCAWMAENPYSGDEFARRGGLFGTASVGELPYLEQEFKLQGNPDAWQALPFLSADGQPSMPVYGPDWAMFPSSAEAQLASWLWVRWLSEPAQQARLAQASSSLPLRRSAVALLQPFAGQHPQWAAAAALLEDGGVAIAPEPGYASWRLGRWALQDATTQLFRDYFTLPDVPDLVSFLQKTLQQMHVELDGEK